MNEEITMYETPDMYSICNYFSDHPIILLGVSLSGVIMATCLLLDKKYNKGEWYLWKLMKI